MEQWADWQLEVLSGYAHGTTSFATQADLATHLRKSLNAVKIKLGRYRKINHEPRRLTAQEYYFFLANRHSYSTTEIATKLGLNHKYLLDELDEIDCLEAKENLSQNYRNRDCTSEEIDIIYRLFYKKKKNRFEIAHIMNREIQFIDSLLNI